MAGFDDFLREVHQSGLPLDPRQADLAARFAEILYRENESQNLTRIQGASEFVDGHLIDVVELLGLPTLGSRILDVGTGSGVPGLLAAALSNHSNRHWILTESEGSKAQYLEKCRAELGLSNATVLPGRAENTAEEAKPDTVIARAVGTVDKIAGWMDGCSTWNNLILFKSRGWEQEWDGAKKTRFGKKLTVIHTHDYSSAGKTRLLVTLKRK